MRNFYIGSLKVHESVGATKKWLQTPIEGLDSPDIRMNNYDNPGEDGGVVSSMFYAPRRVSLRGFIVGDNPADYEAQRLEFLAAVVPKKDSNGYPLPTRITFTTLSGQTYYFDAYLKRPVMDYDQINYARYMLDMIAADPYIYGAAAKTATINRAVGGGAIIPFVVPVTLAPSSGGSGTLINSGTGIDKPTILLTGPLTNPYIANNTVGKFIQLNYTIPAGSFVKIYMANKAIILNDSSSILSSKTDDSDWWGLVSGENNVQFSTGDSADTGNAVFDFNDAYVGV